MARLYISANQMDRWTADGRVVVEDDIMRLPALNRSFKLKSAMRFVATVQGSEDVHALVGKIKSDEQLAALGGEAYGTSVILGEIGYECEEGFLGTPLDGGGSGLLKLGQ